MKQYYLKISSKNEKSLKKFSSFLLKHFKTKFNVVWKSVAIQSKKKIITLLKSPHVNKTAQEHFELRVFSKQIQLNAFYSNKNLIFLKKIINRLFQDISIKLEFVNHLDILVKNRLITFHPNNFKLAKSDLSQKNIQRMEQKKLSKISSIVSFKATKLSDFLNITSTFGEIILIMDNRVMSK